MTLAQYEVYLKEQQLGMAAEMIANKNSYRNRVDGIRAHTSFRIEALESALIETKLKYQRESERAEMQLCEMESKQMNMLEDPKENGLKRVTDIEASIAEEAF